MANGNSIKSPVETTKKVNAYVEGLIKELEAENLNLSTGDKIDIGALLDNIRKKAEEYIKGLKKSLPLSLDHNEIEGAFSRAEYAETSNYDIPIDTLKNELTKEDFYSCLKVVISEVRKKLPEDRFNEIAVKSEPTSRVSFKLIKK